MAAKKIFDEHPRGTDGLWVVILSFIGQRLRVTVAHTGINKHFEGPFCLFHSGEKMNGGLYCICIFGSGNH